ncbi:MAG: ABC transporter permease [Planctomycetota bacterium]|nr:ABC transporter permease [Planctomycetota bacterium]
MKPYIAVLYDSLIESVRSRVLWILMAGWLLILVALFPLSMSEEETYRISSSDLTNARAMLDQLAQATAGRGTRAQRAVYQKLDEDLQSTLQDRLRTQKRVPVGQLVASLNELLGREDLYEKEAWPTAQRREELKELIEDTSKNPAELQKLNRRLIDLAFPGSIRSATGQATWVTYAGMKFMDPLPFTLRQIRPFIEATLFPFIMWLGLGQIAMMVAIVVTAPMIPDMFQTGSLHLLLSKPLSRSLLFLSKYLGGCIFVALNVGFFLVGLYFYAGIQLGIWNRGILWCIPLFIFSFMIFYSVSALVGLIWKNPIICVVLTALFWGLCFTIGVVRGFAEGFLKGPPTIQSIVAVGETPIAANQQGRLLFWNASLNTWQVGFGEVNGQRVLGPIMDTKQGILYFGRTRFVPFGLGGNDSPRLDMVKLPELASKASEASEASEATSQPPSASDTSKKKTRNLWDDSRLDTAPELPNGTSEILPWRDSFLSVTPEGLFGFDRESASKAEQQKISVLGFDLKLPQATEAHKKLTDADWDYRRPIAANSVPGTDSVVLASNGKLVRFDFDGKKLQKQKSIDLDIPAETVVNLVVCGRIAIVCPDAMTPKLIDIDLMQEVGTLDAIGEKTVKRTAQCADGKVALLERDGRLWVLSNDPSGPSPLNLTAPNLVGQGNVSSMAFDQTGRLWVAHHVKQLDVWDNQMTRSEQAFRPSRTTPEFLYDYLINPFYLVNPKPSAIQETIQYVLKNPGNKISAIDRADLDMPQAVSDPWQPLWSNGIFIAVMLSASCWILYRQDL